MIGRDGAKQDARRLTEEIEAATNAALPGNANERGVATGDAGTMNLVGNGADLGRGIISTFDARVLENDTKGGVMLRNGSQDARVLGNGAAILGAAGERAMVENGQNWAKSELGNGRQAVYGPEPNAMDTEAARRAQQAEIVTEMAEVDNGYGKEYIPGVMTAENESSYEITQRKQMEAVNQWNEDHPNGSYGAKLVAKSQEERGQDANRMVNNKYLKNDFEIFPDFWKWFRGEQDQALLDLENPHPIGKGNG